jgi:hypothetical protein
MRVRAHSGEFGKEARAIAALFARGTIGRHCRKSPACGGKRAVRSAKDAEVEQRSVCILLTRHQKQLSTHGLLVLHYIPESAIDSLEAPTIHHRRLVPNEKPAGTDEVSPLSRSPVTTD